MNFLTICLIYEILVFSRLRKHASKKDRKGSNYVGYDYRLRMSVTLQINQLSTIKKFMPVDVRYHRVAT